jgi:hypothetical protein
LDIVCEIVKERALTVNNSAILICILNQIELIHPKKKLKLKEKFTDGDGDQMWRIIIINQNFLSFSQMLAEVAQFIVHERQQHPRRVLDQILHSTPTNVLTLMQRGIV